MATQHRALKHSISMANMDKKEAVKTKLNECIILKTDETFHYVTEEMAGRLNFMINFHILPEKFSKIVKDDFVDQTMLDHLTSTKALNYFRNVKQLYPLNTLGDGNCLLHAASLAMWSFSDHNALLRRLVYVALSSDTDGPFKRRWKRRQERIDKEEGGIVHSSTQEWDRMWAEIKETASDIKLRQPNQLPYKFLEHIHVFVLCNILRRPIIIVSDTVVHYPSGSVHESVNTFDGIYLPLLWQPKDCVKYPLVLGYANSHFAPLLGMDSRMDETAMHLQNVIPLVKHNLEQRTVPFLLENEETKPAKLLGDYLVLRELPQTDSNGVLHILCAELKYNPLEDELNLIWDHFEDLTKAFRKQELPRSPDTEKIPRIPQGLTVNHELSLNLNVNEKPKFGKTAEVAKKNIAELCHFKGPYPGEFSIMEEQCVNKHCNNQASKNTAPYCHEHVRREQRNILNPDPRISDLNLVESNEEMEQSQDSQCSGSGRPCCAPVKCTRQGSIEGQCAHHYATEPLRECSPKCKKAGCAFHGTPKNGEYCAVCVQYYGLEKDDLTILEQLPNRLESEIGKARPFFKCEQDGCYAASTESTLGYCNKHFLELHKAGSMRIPTQEEAETYLRNMREKRRRKSLARLEPPTNKERKRTPSGQVREKKQLCATPGCAGVRCKDNELCLECLRSVRYHLDPHPVVLPHYHVPRDDEEPMEFEQVETRRGNPDIVESAEPSRPESPSSPKCPGPECVNKGLVKYNGMCQSCFQTLRWANVEQPNVPHSTPLRHTSGAQRSLFPESPHQCKTSGCRYVATREQNGYCSSCYGKQQRGDILSEVSQRAIQYNFIQILDKMQPREVIDILFSKMVLNHSQMEELGGMRNVRDQIQYILDHLRTRGSQADYETFIRVLHETRQPHIAQLLTNDTHTHTGTEVTASNNDVRMQSRNQIQPVARPCLSLSCDRFGDPNLHGYCSVCAARGGILAANRTVPIVGHRDRVLSRESQEPGDSGATSRLVISGSGFEESYAKIEHSAVQRQRCKYRGCTNYGNPQNQGYCNAGHIECDAPAHE